VRHYRVQHRGGIGEAGGLDHHAAKRHPSVVAVAQQLFERRDQIAAHRAAQAAARQHDHAVADILHQQVIETDLAELVDEHGGVGERGIFKQLVEQRGLAGAEKTGEHGERDRLQRLAGTRGGACRHALSVSLSAPARRLRLSTPAWPCRRLRP